MGFRITIRPKKNSRCFIPRSGTGNRPLLIMYIFYNQLGFFMMYWLFFFLNCYFNFFSFLLYYFFCW